jgi:transposase InsO family protein
VARRHLVLLYLAAIKDLATREIVGWSMAEHLKAGLCIDALVMALQRCQPPRGLIHHSDRGVQYAAGPYRAVLERHGIQPSMSRRGNYRTPAEARASMEAVTMRVAA